MDGGDDRLLSTGELLARAAVSRAALYRYINAGLVREAERTDSGRRRFAPRMVERVRLVSELNASGYTLRDIRETFKSAFSDL